MYLVDKSESWHLRVGSLEAILLVLAWVNNICGQLLGHLGLDWWRIFLAETTRLIGLGSNDLSSSVVLGFFTSWLPGVPKEIRGTQNIMMLRPATGTVSFLLHSFNHSKSQDQSRFKGFSNILHLLIEKLQSCNIKGHGNRKGNNIGNFF